MTLPPAYPNTPDSIINVKHSGDLSGALDSTKAYLIDGDLDMSGQSIIVPQGGLTIIGNGFNVSRLFTSTTGATLFIDDGVFSGDLFLLGLSVDVTGTSANVFDLDNAGNSNAIEFERVNFNNCTSLGQLDNYRQLLTTNVAFFAPLDGLEVIGAWSGGITTRTTIVINLPSGATLFKAGTAFLVGASVSSDMNALAVDAASTIWDFAPSNFTPDGGFSLTNFRTSATNALPNMPASSVKSNFASCTGIRNTYPGGNWTIGTAVATIISTSDTLVKLAGTTTYSSLEWMSNTTNNAFVYDSSLEIDAIVTVVLSLTGGSNNQIAIQLRLFDDSASAYVNIGPEFSATMNSGGRVENVYAQGIVTLNENDRIEIWVKNLSGSSNITAEVGGQVLVQERSSI